MEIYRDREREFGTFLRIARETIKLSQVEIAENFSVSSKAVGKWETGLTLPEEEKIPKIAEIYRVNENTARELFSFAKRQRKEMKKARTSTKDRSFKKRLEYSFFN
jgi:transcriptional regulator with XRE-family HTH domain